MIDFPDVFVLGQGWGAGIIIKYLLDVFVEIHAPFVI